MKKGIVLLSILTGLVCLGGCLSDDDAGVSFEDQLEIDIQKIDQYLDENQIAAEEDSSGIRYRVLEASEGPIIQSGSIIGVKYSLTNLENDLLIYEDSAGLVATVDPGLIGAWQIILPKLRVGDKVTIYSPSGYAYGPLGSGDNIGPNANIIFDIEIFAGVTDSISQVDIEGMIIDEYLAENGITGVTTDTISGIRYKFLQRSAGPSPTLNDEVRVNYVGKFLNISPNSIFDQDTSQAGKVFLLSTLIESWRRMIPLMKEGEKMIIFTPSVYAYGEAGSRNIPSNAILIFEIELLEVM